MNTNNYGSLKACQDLVTAGIVLETEKVWAFVPNHYDMDQEGNSRGVWKLIDPPLYPYRDQIPAPSMSELWRELPESIQINAHTWKHLTTEKMGSRMEAYYRPCDKSEIKSSENPCDALADLLIWVRGRDE
jgi:hypothetical protein